jgi:hypothetical protein
MIQKRQNDRILWSRFKEWDSRSSVLWVNFGHRGLLVQRTVIIKPTISHSYRIEQPLNSNWLQLSRNEIEHVTNAYVYRKNHSIQPLNIFFPTAYFLEFEQPLREGSSSVLLASNKTLHRLAYNPLRRVGDYRYAASSSHSEGVQDRRSIHSYTVVHFLVFSTTRPPLPRTPNSHKNQNSSLDFRISVCKLGSYFPKTRLIDHQYQKPPPCEAFHWFWYLLIKYGFA